MDYYQGYDDAMRQARVTRSSGMIGFLMRAIVSLLLSVFVYVPLILLSYFIANKMAPLYSNDLFIKIGVTISVAYLLFSFVYFLKGVMMAGRNNSRYWWVIVWIFCVSSTSVIQALIGQELLEQFFLSRNVANYQIWSWIGASAIAIFIYSHYKFLTNLAPRSVFWSYRLGFSIVKPKTNNVTQANPSKDLFDNVPMTVSFKRISQDV